MIKKNFTDNGVCYRIKKHTVLYLSDFDENNNIKFCTYIKKIHKTEQGGVHGFDKLKIIEGICDFNKEQFIITNINKEKCLSENEFNNIFERTQHILNKEVMSNI